MPEPRTVNPCFECGGTGEIEGETCVACLGTGYRGGSDLHLFLLALKSRIDDIEDKLDDILDKCNDILDKCNDILDKCKRHR